MFLVTSVFPLCFYVFFDHELSKNEFSACLLLIFGPLYQQMTDDAVFSDEVLEKIPELVQGHPALWNKHDSKFKLKPIKMALYDDISKSLGVDPPPSPYAV